MPALNIRNVNIHYRVFGEHGPWLTLITGGRRGFAEFVPLAGKIAAHGVRVLLHDRRNTGASDVVIDGTEGEEEIWTDDLYELLGRLGARPAVVGGSSSGARTSIITYLRHPDAVRALFLMRLTGGEFAAGRLPEMYYGQFIRAAREGGMAAVCATEQYQERIAANPANRERLMRMDPKRYIEVMHPRAERGHPRQRPDPLDGLRPRHPEADSRQPPLRAAPRGPGGTARALRRLGAARGSHRARVRGLRQRKMVTVTIFISR
jgi:pimeloyl-ACP methyl ester carboxylesterase